MQQESYAPSLSSNANLLFKRKTLKACDTCRRRKVRCDGQDVYSDRCTNCASSQITCTYTIPTNVQKRGSKAHIEDLQIRISNAEKLLNLLSPGINLPEVLSQVDKNPSSPSKKISRGSGPSSPNPPLQPADAAKDELQSSDDEYKDHRNLTEYENPKFLGKSSGFKFIQFAMDSRNFITGKDLECTKANLMRRDEYWGIKDWMRSPYDHRRVDCNFPEPDLLASLVDLYFTHINSFLPILHRPTFERAIADELHQRDIHFAMVLLLVCATANRYCDDPRVSAVSYDHCLSPGWGWFYKAQEMQRSMMFKPSLYDLQAYCLSAIFLKGASPDYSRWTLLGTGIRLGMEVGVHSRRKYGDKPTVQSELWKRAFWALTVMDRSASLSHGRSCGLQPEDLDLDLPIECNDEYWQTDDPETDFKQPTGEPSYVSYFVYSIKMSNIVASMLRKLCAISKFEKDKDWEKHTLTRIERDLSIWEASVPEHLRWDPDCENILHCRQAVLLRAQYCAVKLASNRPFLQSPKHAERALKVSSNEARDFVTLLEAAREKMGVAIRDPATITFSCAVHLLLNVWRENQLPDSKDMQRVRTCSDLLGSVEHRWHAVGRLRDLLHGLISSTDLPNKSEVLRNWKIELHQMLASSKASTRPLPREDQLQLDPNADFSSRDSLWVAQPLDGTVDPYILDAQPQYYHDYGQNVEQLLLGPNPAAASPNRNRNHPPPQLSASFWMDLDSSAFDPDSAQPEALSIEPFTLTSVAESEVLSAGPASNEFDDWSSYLLDLEEMVKGMQDGGGSV